MSAGAVHSPLTRGTARFDKGRRILVLLTDGFGARGGIAKFNRDFLTALSSDVHTERVVALPRHVTDAVGALPDKLTYRIQSAGTIARFSRTLAAVMTTESRFDLVVCGHINLIPLAALAALRFRAPNMLIMHGVEVWQPTARPITDYLTGTIDSFVAVSEYTKHRFLSWAPVASERGAVLPNCVDLSAFSPGPKSPELLQRHGLAGRTIIMTLARLWSSERYKGIDEILECLPDLAKHIPNLSYLIVGEGDDRERLEQKAASLGVRERVVFSGYIPEHEKADHYRLADSFAMPSRGEGFGIVYLEAMACGIPTLASTLDAGPEAVRDSEIAVLADPRDRQGLQAALLKSLRMPKGNVPTSLSAFSQHKFEQRVHQLLTTGPGNHAHSATFHADSGA